MKMRLGIEETVIEIEARCIGINTMTGKASKCTCTCSRPVKIEPKKRKKITRVYLLHFFFLAFSSGTDVEMIAVSQTAPPAGTVGMMTGVIETLA